MQTEVIKQVFLVGKDVFSSCHARGTKNKILTPCEESNLRPSDSALRRSTTELQRLYGKQGPLRGSYMARVQYTAWISNVLHPSYFFNKLTFVAKRYISASAIRRPRGKIIQIYQSQYKWFELIFFSGFVKLNSLRQS